MSFFTSIVHKYAANRFRRRFRNLKRSGKVCNLAGARSVGLIYDAGSPEKQEAVKQYVRYLKEEEGIRQIKALGYVHAKQLPENLKTKLEFDFITRNDISWDQRPSGGVVRNFIAEPFDILIDLEPTEIIPLRYLLNWSKAGFKVGYLRAGSEAYYDLLLDVKTPEMQLYIAQVNHYLSIINKVS